MKQLSNYRGGRILRGQILVVPVLAMAGFLMNFDVALGESPGSTKLPRGKSRLSHSEDPLDLPIRSKACVIEDEVYAASRITSKNFNEVRSEYLSTIESFQVVKGQTVKKGQLIATTNSSMLKNMQSIYQDYAQLYKAQLKIASNNENLATARRDRLRGLVAKGIIPQSELDEANNYVIAAANTRDRISRGLEGMQKTLDQYADQIRKSNFYSGMDGVVTELIVDPRSMTGTLNVMPGTLVAKIEQPGTYRAEALLMDTQIHAIKQGMKADLTLPDGSEIHGKITFVSTLPHVEVKREAAFGAEYGAEQPKTSSHTIYKAVIEFVRPGAILPPGLLAHVRIVTGETKVASCLPWNAVDIVEGRAYARTFTEGRGWARSPITIGKMGRYEVEISPPIGADTIIKSKLW